MGNSKKGLKASDYVHLHNHTQYSLLDGLTKVPMLVEAVKAMGMQSIAITDHGTLSGVIEFYNACNNGGIKPIIGMEAYVASRKHTNKEAGHDKQIFHLIIIAMNNTGYQNLMRLSTIANLDGFYYKPRVDHDLLKKYNEGLIILSGCMNGEVADALNDGRYEDAKKTASWYKKVFKDRYYIEIQDHGHPNHPSRWDQQTRVNDLAYKLAEELELKTVITGDAHYLKHDDQEAHEILLCVQTGSFLSDTNRMSLRDFELHVADPKEVIGRWGVEHPESILNTKEIADRCQVDIKLGEILIPKFPVPKGENEGTYLKKMVYQGLAWRYGGVTRDDSKNLSSDEARSLIPRDVVDRAEYELEVIEKMGFNGYFLIVADFINWGKEQGIVFGPGRGSAAGSIIAYAINITELDPLKYDLLFERFLNPDRISMPDVDIDIQDTRRDEVIQYCVDKYGEDRVANIVTFGRMAARNAVRDVARVLQVPYSEADRLAKMIPPPVQGRHIPLESSIVNDQDLKNEYETNKTAKEVFDLAIRLEGTIRSHGVHAAGVVIAPDEIVKFTPLEMAQKGVISTQYSMGPVDQLGLLKMDFLGLSNLTIIKNALRIIKKVHSRDIDIGQIPLDDTKTFDLLQRGDTTGVFQLESAGMKRYLKELKPTEFDDIIAMVALYRPGPMQFIDDFINRKHGRKEVTYEHPGLKDALQNTYGILVYQEQFMQISKDMCGFTGGQADTLRKAIGKKQRETMAKMKVAFIDGMVENSKVDRAFAEKFWAQLEAFADYCFNKSHSACYGLVAYWTAYLKAHFPAEFMAALMTSDYDDIDRLAIEINECKHMGITVLLPDVNESFIEFAVVRTHEDASTIRFGMNAIKNVGTSAVEEILRARSDGKFSSIEDFLTRVSPRIVNKKALESLIKTGALDAFGDRSILLNNIENLLSFSSRVQKELSSGQTDLFGAVEITGDFLPKLILDESLPEYTSREQLIWERELLGLYLSQHPLSDYQIFLTENCLPIKEIVPEHEGKNVKIGGSILNFKEIMTKNGAKMAFVTISDMDSEVELILFPGTYQQTIDIWSKDNVVLVTGKVSCKDRDGIIGDEIKILVDDAREISYAQVKAYQPRGRSVKVPRVSSPKKSALAKAVDKAKNSDKPLSSPKRLYVRISDTSKTGKLEVMKQKLDLYGGDTEIVVVLGPDESKQLVKLSMKVNPSKDLVDELVAIFGESQVKIH